MVSNISEEEFNEWFSCLPFVDFFQTYEMNNFILFCRKSQEILDQNKENKNVHNYHYRSCFRRFVCGVIVFFIIERRK